MGNCPPDVCTTLTTFQRQIEILTGNPRGRRPSDRFAACRSRLRFSTTLPSSGFLDNYVLNTFISQYR